MTAVKKVWDFIVARVTNVNRQTSEESAARKYVPTDEEVRWARWEAQQIVQRARSLDVDIDMDQSRTSQ